MMIQSFTATAQIMSLPHGRGAQGNGLKTATVGNLVSYEPHLKG